VGRPGLVGTVARTAVVAGTATATAGAVSRHQANKAAEKQAADQQAADQQAAEQEAAQAPPAYQPPPPAYQPPPPAYQPPPAPEPAAGGEDDLVSQIGQLAQLRDAGVLSEAEFSAAKGKLLGL
jgi:hemolysin activation/secretion protein